jgi:hypothetical protein
MDAPGKKEYTRKLLQFHSITRANLGVAEGFIQGLDKGWKISSFLGKMNLGLVLVDMHDGHPIRKHAF